MMYLEGDSPHQKIMFMCECIWSSYIITFNIMMYLCSLAKVSRTTCILFATLDTIVQVQCDLAITRNTCGSIYFLNYLNLFWNKIWLDLFSLFWSRIALHLELRLCFCLTCFLSACFDGYLGCVHLVLFLLLGIFPLGFSTNSLIPPRYLLDTLIPASSIEISGFLLYTSR